VTDGQTDGQTDGIAVAYTRYSIYAVVRNEVALQRADTRIIRWMCDVKVKDRVPSKELRERLDLDDTI